MVIGWGCITSAKYEQKATLLRQGYASTVPVTRPADGGELTGSYEIKQHPITGQPIRIWVPAETDTGLPDNPETEEKENLQTFRFDCQARAILSGGLNSQGTTERFTSKGDYENVDFVELQVPSNVIITKRDRVTNITDSRGNVIWMEEEYGRFKPTVFDVMGVAPSVDPFGSHVENFIRLKRSEIQDG